ncbi:hypothetical protein J3R82DRAFT_10879 [Butyriboletus roseoflavus]|nr:hypothetical protein J3R82DRAFT_10879 [Butyriboletus roseoflavus]
MSTIFHSILVCSVRLLSHDHVLSSPVTRRSYTYPHLPSLSFSPSTPYSQMSTSPPIPRPPSRSERLLRDTLRKDDTLRTHATHTSSRPRSASSNCGDDDDDDDFFQSAILFRCSSRRNSAASAPAHGHPSGFYIPDQNEHASYSRLLRSSSYSGSSRSSRSGRNSSPRPAYAQEKHEELSRHNDAAPHEAVLRSRFDSVIHSMRIDNDRDAVESTTTSLPSSLGSISNSRTHSHESHRTHLTVPDPVPCLPLASQPKRTSPSGHRHSQSASIVHPQSPSPRRTFTPSRVAPQSPRSPRAPQGLRSPPRTPTSQEKEQLKRRHPDSPWMYAPLPPSPPTFSASPSRHGGPAVVTFVASPPIAETHTTRPPPRHSPISSTFDPEAASHALRQLPGYVSFASVAGLGAPPEEEDRRGARRPFAGFTLGGGKGRLSGLGLGGGKWWMF